MMSSALIWLDLRDEASYLAGHFERALHLDKTYLQSCLNALPSRDQPLGLIASAEDLISIKQHLEDKGYQIKQTLTPDAILQPGLVVKTGKNSFQAWQPNKLLQEQLPGLKTASHQALDLGCGGGRDAIYLALHGWQVSAIDQQQRVLQCAQQLARIHGVKVNWVEADVHQPHAIPNQPFDLIMMVRFLDRRLFSMMRNQCRVGGYVLVQTFVEGVETFGSPKNPNYILRFGELAKEFSEFDIIVDRIDRLNDGRPIASFLARRKQGEKNDYHDRQ
ncbi:class I SAM-dependent methyltransferase [Thiomicrospira microaerophila]|uniref:class I SAM-dependent methyltransferase n=1 Tax=Thiomicrospira microaerophila TaxID=406020 RepID=UPI000698BFDD|nr:class I SAM-dependent methyltransferase [Thiomicrospira microaerophila]